MKWSTFQRNATALTFLGAVLGVGILIGYYLIQLESNTAKVCQFNILIRTLDKLVTEQNAYVNFVNQQVKVNKVDIEIVRNKISEDERKWRIFHYKKEQERHRNNIKRLQNERRQLNEALKECRPEGLRISIEGPTLN